MAVIPTCGLTDPKKDFFAVYDLVQRWCPHSFLPSGSMYGFAMDCDQSNMTWPQQNLSRMKIDILYLAGGNLNMKLDVLSCVGVGFQHLRHMLPLLFCGWWRKGRKLPPNMTAVNDEGKLLMLPIRHLDTRRLISASKIYTLELY
jgi:hypothetical protein